MMLRLIVLSILFTLCMAGENDIPCSNCHLTKDQYPAEGKMACFKVRKSTMNVTGKITECKSKCLERDQYDNSCIKSNEVCKEKESVVKILDCGLIQYSDKDIIQREEEHGTIYQINSPNYFGYKNYPNSTFCVWNIANEGVVSYRIVDQTLQNATDCDDDDEDCKCPDHMKISMGGNEMKLCGSKRPDINNQMSSDGLHVKFCSDNANSAKGILVMAYRHKDPTEVPTLQPIYDGDSKKKRQASETCENRIEEMSTNMSRMGCQYEYMMRMSQPGSPCPDDSTIISLVNYHDYMMTGFEQTMDMCDGSHEVMTMDMYLMNNIESCAVDYLYRKRDCEFAKKVVNATNGELSDVARMIVENNFPIRAPKWMDTPRKKCK